MSICIIAWFGVQFVITWVLVRFGNNCTTYVQHTTHTHTQNPESGGSGGSRFSLKTMATKLRGGDTSYEGRLAIAVRELQEAEDTMKQAQQELE